MAKGLLPICKTPKTATALASLGLGKGTGRDNIGSDESRRSQASKSDFDWDDLDNLPELDAFRASQALNLDLDTIIAEDFLVTKGDLETFELFEALETDVFFVTPPLAESV